MDALTLPQRITLLRQQLPASIRICRQALMESGGDLAVAHAWIVRRLIAEYRQRTGAPVDEAAADLQRCGHDVERALVLWQRRYPAPLLPPLERIAQGHPLAAELPAQDDLRRFVHRMPTVPSRRVLSPTPHASPKPPMASTMTWPCRIR